MGRRGGRSGRYDTVGGSYRYYIECTIINCPQCMGVRQMLIKHATRDFHTTTPRPALTVPSMARLQYR
jgi:hypothetical protein